MNTCHFICTINPTSEISMLGCIPFKKYIKKRKDKNIGHLTTLLSNAHVALMKNFTHLHMHVSHDIICSSASASNLFNLHMLVSHDIVCTSSSASNLFNKIKCYVPSSSISHYVPSSSISH